MSHHDDQSNGGEHPMEGHFDELDAVRRFPSEDSWLDLPMPDLSDDSVGVPAADGPADADKAGDDAPFASPSTFADRVLKARQDDLELDEQIAELDRALPPEVLAQFRAPEPSASFVDRTVQKATEERRQRWQKMLSRYVAPEPSPEFVSKTLAALQEDGNARAATAGRPPEQLAQPEVRRLQAPSDVQRRSQNRTVFGLVAAAAAALVWVSLSGEVRPPLEVRLANQASPAVAYASSTSPMSAILAQVAEDEEPFAMFDEPADGLWLVGDFADGDFADGEELR